MAGAPATNCWSIMATGFWASRVGSELQRVRSPGSIRCSTAIPGASPAPDKKLRERSASGYSRNVPRKNPPCGPHSDFISEPRLENDEHRAFVFRLAEQPDEPRTQQQ